MEFAPWKRRDLQTFDAYLASLTSPIDSFLEDHLLQSQFYRITDAGKEIGSFAVRNAAQLTQFFMAGPSRRQAKDVFAEILRQHTPRIALVPTCDEFFLSHALDRCAKVEMQAFFFVDGRPTPEPSPKPPRIEYRPAELSDVPAIKAFADTFLDNPERDILDEQVRVGSQGREMVAIGLIVRSQFWPDQASIGMFTHEAYRRQGIGTQTILYLKKTCLNAGIIPLAGCGYDNRNSRLTLQAAGMITVTRLLRIVF